MERLKVVDLKALSKSLSLKGYSRLRRAKLVRLIMDHLSSRPRPRPLQVMKPLEGIIRRRPPKPTRSPPAPPPRPIPPPKPPHIVQRYQLKNKGSVVGDVQQPEGMDQSPKVKYDPKKLKHMK